MTGRQPQWRDGQTRRQCARPLSPGLAQGLGGARPSWSLSVRSCGLILEANTLPPSPVSLRSCFQCITAQPPLIRGAGKPAFQPLARQLLSRRTRFFQVAGPTGSLVKDLRAECTREPSGLRPSPVHRPANRAGPRRRAPRGAASGSVSGTLWRIPGKAGVRVEAPLYGFRTRKGRALHPAPGRIFTRHQDTCSGVLLSPGCPTLGALRPTPVRCSALTPSFAFA